MRKVETDGAALLPCPFCGGEAEQEDDDGGIRVRCWDCGGRSGWFLGHEVSALAAEWNTRPAIEAKDAEIARLRKALSVIAHKNVWDSDGARRAAVVAVAALQEQSNG